MKDVPIDFIMRVRDMSDSPEASGSGLKRAMTTKLKVKSFSSRMLGKLQRKSSVENVGLNSFSHSTSLNSFNNSNGLRSVPVQQRMTAVRVGRTAVTKLEEWTARCEGSIHEYNMEFRENVKLEGIPEKIVGRMTLQAIFVKPTPDAQMELLPLDFKEFTNGLSNLKLHERVWKKGFMYQKGGDTNVYQLNVRIGNDDTLNSGATT
jgi:hypothetical protein